MNLSGSHEFPASRERVYELLVDAEALQHCMPGCERLTPLSDAEFDLEMKVPVPAVKGEYRGKVTIVEQRRPEFLRMRIEADGKSGFVNADATMRLAQNGGGSTLSYEATAQVGGPAASVGQRVLTGISRHQLGQMMRCLEQYEKGAPAKRGLWARLLRRLRLRRDGPRP